MLIAFVALIYLINLGLGVLHTSFQTLLGYPLAPVAWLLGVPWKDAATIGNLMGTKVVVNEFVAFSMLGPLKGHIAERSFTIATFALCGFANFSSIGIQIGGIGALAPTTEARPGQTGIPGASRGHSGQLHGGGHRRDCC